MAKVDEHLSDLFGVPKQEKTRKPRVKKEVPVVAEVPPVPVPTEQSTPAVDDPLKDFEFVRSKLYSLLEEGSEAFLTLSDLAQGEEKVSAFGAMNDMMTNLSDIAVKLLEIQERKQKIVGTKPDSQATNTTNNAIFVGTTADLAKLLPKDFNFGDTFDSDE